MPTRSSAWCTLCLRSLDDIPRYVRGNSTFSYTFKSPIRLKLWKINPISRLRIRERWLTSRFATEVPFKVYSPSDGESSNPIKASKVDLPDPDGPAMETYSH